MRSRVDSSVEDFLNIPRNDAFIRAPNLGGSCSVPSRPQAFRPSSRVLRRVLLGRCTLRADIVPGSAVTGEHSLVLEELLGVLLGGVGVVP